MVMGGVVFDKVLSAAEPADKGAATFHPCDLSRVGEAELPDGWDVCYK